MGEFEPESMIISHEVGILVEAVAPRAEIAETDARLGRSFMYVELDDGTPKRRSFSEFHFRASMAARNRTRVDDQLPAHIR